MANPLLKLPEDAAYADELGMYQTMVHDLEHRMKNMLAVVQSLAYQSFREGAALAPARDAFLARLATLGRTYDLLGVQGWSSADLRALVEMVLVPQRIDPARLTIAGPPLVLSAQSATSFALAIHELAANAASFGALANTTGRIEILWTANNGHFVFTWRESDGPRVEKPTVRGFGRRLIELSLPSQFQGVLRYEFLPGGVELELAAPLAAVATG